MAGKADLVNSIVDGVDGAAATQSPGDAAYASLHAAEAEAEPGGWMADGVMPSPPGSGAGPGGRALRGAEAGFRALYRWAQIV